MSKSDLLWSKNTVARQTIVHGNTTSANTSALNNIKGNKQKAQEFKPKVHQSSPNYTFSTEQNFRGNVVLVKGYCKICGYEAIHEIDDFGEYCPVCGNQLFKYTGTAKDLYNKVNNNDLGEISKPYKLFQSTSIANTIIKAILIGIAILFIYLIIVNVNGGIDNHSGGAYGEVLYLKNIGDNTYKVVGTSQVTYNKILYWDKQSQSYYDEASNCYLKYDKIQKSPVWLYWFDSVSNNYNDYGWLYYDNGWYIEVSANEWKPIEINNLWHIE